LYWKIATAANTRSVGHTDAFT